MKQQLYRFLQMSLVMLLFAVLGCSGSSNSGSAVKTGVIKSPNETTSGLPVKAGKAVASDYKLVPVDGLSYEAKPSGKTGTTKDGGKFYYVEGDEVTFSVGDIELGSSQGSEAITTFDLVDFELGDTTEVSNLINFLAAIADTGSSDVLDISKAVEKLNASSSPKDTLQEALAIISDGELSLNYYSDITTDEIEYLFTADDTPKLTADMFNDKSFVYLVSETDEKGVATFKSDGKLIDDSDDDVDSWSIENGKLIIKPAYEDEAEITATLISKTGNTIMLLVKSDEDDPYIRTLIDNKDLKFIEAMVKGETFNYHEVTTDILGETVQGPESGSITFNADYTVCGIDENGHEFCDETWSISDKGQLCIVDDDGEEDKDCFYLFSQKDKTIVAFIKEGENTSTLTLTEFDPSKEVTLSSGDFFKFNPESWGGSSIMYDDLEGNLFLPHSMALLVEQKYADITQAPYGVYRDSNGNNPPVFPAKAGDVYVFQSQSFPEEGYAMPDYYRLEIISATKRPSVESTELGTVKFKYAKILAPDFVDNVFGEWVFDDNYSLSVMGLEMMDYRLPPETYEMFFFDRMSATSKNTVQGTVGHFVENDRLESTVKLTFTPKGEKLDVKIEKLEGAVPLVNTTLTNGVKQVY